MLSDRLAPSTMWWRWTAHPLTLRLVDASPASRRAAQSLLFTFTPRTALLTTMHAVGAAAEGPNAYRPENDPRSGGHWGSIRCCNGAWARGWIRTASPSQAMELTR
jgi:hypothetical protein